MVQTYSFPTAQPSEKEASAPPAAELLAVSKRYGEIAALENVSLELRPGEVVALLGPNGAGKTTAVGLMLGLMRPTQGAVRLFGADPQTAVSRMRVGTMLQLSGVPETLTVGEHLRLFASYYPKPLAPLEVLERCGLVGLERRLYGKLSGGQKGRVHLALALIGDPDLLFLDEPTTGLDVGARRGLWEGVRGFVAEGKTVLLTTHYLEEADALADRVVLLNHGRIIAEGTPEDIKARTAGRRVRCETRVPLETIRTWPQVSSASRDGAQLDILVSRAEPVVFELLSRDPELSGLEVSGAGLEEAFLALTKETNTKGTTK